MNSPRVTVLIPTFDYAEVLPYSIGSVLSQSFTDFELLVIGDGCTDDSEKVVRSIVDPRVHWHNLPENTGNASGPNNVGLRHARGRIIAYLGHDDLWLPNHLGPLVEAIEAGADFAYAIGAFFAPDGRDYLHPIEAFEGPPGTSPTVVAHTKAIAEAAGSWLGPSDLASEQDEDFFRRIYEAGAVTRFVPQVSAIKLDAARRKDVYRERPIHEQQAWTERIRHGALLELVDLQAARTKLLRERSIRDQSVASGLFGVARALTRAPRQWLRRRRAAKRAGPYEDKPYAGLHDWSAYDEAERARRYRALYDERRAFKGLPPLEGRSGTSREQEKT